MNGKGINPFGNSSSNGPLPDFAQLLPTKSDVDWHEWLRCNSMSSGIYRLAKGAEDPQSPHNEDELYVCIQGLATLRVADQSFEMKPGVTVFVPAKVEHRFEEIREDLTVVVVFAPPESK